MTRTFQLREIPEVFAVCKLSPGDPVPHWAISGNTWSVTQTGSELSIVCPQKDLPEGIDAVRSWRALQVVGPLSFEMVGVLSTLTVCLADAGISIFAISTYETDLILIREESFHAACQALVRAGNTIESR
jgi:hypothetical protein